MNQRHSYVIPLIALIAFFSQTAMAEDATQTTIAHFKQIKHTKPFFKNAYGYAVFPTVGSAGFIIGGAYGKGTVYSAPKNWYSFIGFSNSL